MPNAPSPSSQPDDFNEIEKLLAEREPARPVDRRRRFAAQQFAQAGFESHAAFAAFARGQVVFEIAVILCDFVDGIKRGATERRSP